MTKAEGHRSRSAAESAAVSPPSPFVSLGGELQLSNLGQLELLRGMAERGVPLRTTVRGFSMAPFIRDQDVLTIAPIDNRAPRVGEVIAFTLPNSGRMAIHRVVGHAGAGWLVRGDNCPGADGVVARDDMVGRVVRVERRGRNVRLGLGAEGAWVGALSRGGGLMRLRMLWRLQRRAAAFALQRAQGLPLYRAAGRRLAARVEIVEASQDDVAAVHHHLNPRALYPRQPPNPQVTNWVARRGVKVIGFVQLVYHPEADFPWVGHWLFSLAVWRQYHGLGVGEALTRRVIGRAQAQGAEELLLAVLEDNGRAIELYRKLGFEHVTLAALEPAFVKEREQSGRRRIVMRKRLSAAG
jgi:ribosomal protein S18 acetylase RimI-like enzyme